MRYGCSGDQSVPTLKRNELTEKFTICRRGLYSPQSFFLLIVNSLTASDFKTYSNQHVNAVYFTTSKLSVFAFYFTSLFLSLLREGYHIRSVETKIVFITILL